MRRIIGPLLALLTLTGAYLYGFPAPTLAYGAGVVAHVLGGLVATVLLVLLARTVGGQSWPARIGWAATVLGATLRHRDRQDGRDAPLPAAREGPHCPQHARHRDPRGGAHGATGRPPISCGAGLPPSRNASADRRSLGGGGQPCDDCSLLFSPSPRSPLPLATARGTCGRCAGTSRTASRTRRCRRRR